MELDWLHYTLLGIIVLLGLLLFMLTLVLADKED